MQDEDKSKEQLLVELKALRQRLAESEKGKGASTIALRQSEREKTILDQIANVFLTIPDEKIYEEVLAVIVNALKCRYGVFGYTGDNGDLIIPGMTTEIWSECRIEEKSIVFPRHLWGNSLWGKSLIEKKSFSSDGPFQTPEGHLPVYNFLTVPIVFADKTIGVAAVANKDGGFSPEDKTILERVADHISPVLNTRLQRDIQGLKRKRTEDALRESEARLRQIIDLAPLMIFVKDLEGKYLLANKAVADVHGTSVSTLIGKYQSDFHLDANQLQNMLQDDREVITKGEAKSIQEEAYTDRQGNLRFFRTAKVPFHLLGDKTPAVLGVAMDITVNKRAKEVQRESEACLAATIESIPFEFWAIGPDGCYSMQNRICRKHYGDLIGKRPEDVCPNETILSVWLENNRRAFAGELVKGEVKYVFGDDERYFYNVVAPIHDGDRTLGIVGINVDITNCKRLQAELKEINEELENQVSERTKELDAKTRRLEEFNAALRVLLKQREVDKTELEESILMNVKSLIVPYVEKLKKSRLGGDQMTYLTIIETHMQEITSPFTRRLSEKYLGFTPVEVQTVGLIREGKTTQEIAGVLCVSENTVSSNRFHIRKKLGLTNKKVNLRYYLQSFEK